MLVLGFTLPVASIVQLMLVAKVAGILLAAKSPGLHLPSRPAAATPARLAADHLRHAADDSPIMWDKSLVLGL